MEKMTATFAAGCFWGVQKAFDGVAGVLNTQVGYTGGHVTNPSYEMVCGHKTGHAEAIRIEFDPDVISFTDLLDIFWRIHDPSSLNRQGPDIGTQYRSAIFYHDEDQRMAAEKSKQALVNRLQKGVVTEIVAVGPFYPAEAYHQHYLKKQKRGI